MKKLPVFSGVLFCLSFPLALAYLDPGTGGVIIGSIWPLIVAMFAAIGAFIVKHFWTPIKRLSGKIFGRK